jgi:hypothetical protein
MQSLQFKSKTDTIIYALQELLRRRSLRELASLGGKVPLALDLDQLRKRPARKSRGRS